MYKLCLLLALVVALSLGTVRGATDPDLIGWWWFDEGSGSAAADSSLYGNHGALMGDTAWVPGVVRTALQFDGVDDYVEVPHAETLTVDNEVTVAVWINARRHNGPGGEGWQGIVSKSNSPRSYSLYTQSSGNLHFSTAGYGSTSSTIVPLNEWVHVCAMVRAGAHVYFINGEPAGQDGSGIVLPGAADTANVVIGRTSEGTSRSFLGMIDDLRLYRRALTQEEVRTAMAGRDLLTTIARDPIPGDGEQDVRRDVVLAWKAGEYAVAHDVYFGTVADDVNDASRANPMGILVSQGQTPASYAPDDLLAIGQTYYWRVDEVNAAPDNTIFKGNLWSFTVEPFAYPVTSIIATTNGGGDPDAGPQKTVDGSGLSASDEHSTAASDMWLTPAPAGEPLWIQYEFDKVYKLNEMLVWNYNVQFEMLLGLGIKEVGIEYSADGEVWMALGDFELAQATARATYMANTTIDFGGVAARYVRLTAHSSWGGTGQFGLSEVRFLYIPAQAREPQPADGAADVSVDSVLTWRAGRDAVSHEVYFGTDAEALALADTVSATSYAPGALHLGTTYYWRIDAIQETESWEGAVWSFRTQQYLVVEDFESYTDDVDSGQAIFDTWLDGWVNGTGSTVGHLQSPFAERTIVRSGRQSMPLFYDNTTAAVSEADFGLSRDWTTNGVRSLSLHFCGAAGNTGRLYVKINDAKVAYDGDAADIARPTWQPWNIDLSAIGGVNNVRSLTIGIEGAGATGIVYIDDIRLYPHSPEFIVPVEPDTANLVGHWKLDDGSGTTAVDSSGKGHNGTLTGGSTWVTGVVGGALQFAASRYVDCGAAAAEVTGDFTLATWVKLDAGTAGHYHGIGGKLLQSGGNYFGFGLVRHTGNAFRLWVGDGTDDLAKSAVSSDTPYIDSEWHHVVGVRAGRTNRLYIDGVQQTATSVTGFVPSTDFFHLGRQYSHLDDRYLRGAMDDVRVYDRALSAEEIAGLAGLTVQRHKPF